MPLELPPKADEFFGRRDELDRLIHRLRSGKDTAVVGAAGMGKTALAAKALLEVVGETQKSLAESPFPDGIVFLDLYVLRAAVSQRGTLSPTSWLEPASWSARRPESVQPTPATLGAFC